MTDSNVTDKQIYNWLFPDKCWHETGKDITVNICEFECKHCSISMDEYGPVNPDFSTPDGMMVLLEGLEGKYDKSLMINFFFTKTPPATSAKKWKVEVITSPSYCTGYADIQELALRGAVIKMMKEEK